MTDVQGSTRLWEENASAMRVAVARHDELAAEIVSANQGHLVKARGEGDSLFCVFERATDAADTAIALLLAFAAEPWPSGISLIVRAAMHTGEVELRKADYYGPAVNRTARLRGLAHGGQILVSAPTHQLIKDALPPRATLLDLGEHRLRDLLRPEHVFQLGHVDLVGEFPDLHSLDQLPNNLPIQLTSFIGRERELAEMKQLVVDSRLLTVTGTGGAGKTRLSLQLAADLIGGDGDGVWLVELASLLDPMLVTQALASVLSLREEAGRPLRDTIVESLRSRRTIIVLDNCEQVLAACAELANAILRNCPGVKVIATSREALQIAGETTYRIPSLPTPNPKLNLAPEELQGFEAVHLFLDRARAADPSFALTAQNARAIAQICHRLDGIPLALELAAARARAMPIDSLASRLDDRFRLLTGGSRTALPRQQTLRALIDWSYDLLTDAEKIVLRRLSVFAGGWTLDAAEAVTADVETLANPAGSAFAIEPFEVADILVSLIDKSLVVYERDRYRMLETMRAYSAGRLTETPEAVLIRDRHVAFFAQLAQMARAGLRGAEQRDWLERLDVELDNCYAAMEWGLSGGTGSAEAAGLAAGALSGYWSARGRFQEALYWLRRAAEAQGVRPEVQTFARHRLATILSTKGDFTEALMVQERLVHDARDLADDLRLGDALSSMAYALFCAGRLDEAREAAMEALEIARRMGSAPAEGYALTTLALTAMQGGDSGSAWEYGQQVLTARRRSGAPRPIAVTLANLGQIARARNDVKGAHTLFLEAVALAMQTHARQTLGHALEGLGACAVTTGHYPEAARLLGKGDAILRELDVHPDAIDRHGYDETLAKLRASIPSEEVATLWAGGASMSDDAAVRLAQGLADPIAR